jgi:formylglycine-generating enzyme required for sulfatase activity
MVHIDAGKYYVGTATPDDYHVASQAVDLPGFWIDKLLATNAQYKAFVDKSGRRAPMTWKDGAYPRAQDNRPVEGLTWDDAQAFCEAQNKRLPNEAEWEVAARGTGDTPPPYPWGSDPSAGGKFDLLSPTSTYDTGSMDFNKSPFGVYDLAGTVWQWVGTPYGPLGEGNKVLRGGRHGFLEDMAYRQQAKPNDDRFSRVAGVRCAADHVAGE